MSIDTNSTEVQASVLDVRNLQVAFNRAAPTIDDVSFRLRAGEVLALVGESGSGKSVTSFATMGLLPSNGEIVGGSIDLDGVGDLAGLRARDLRRVQGGEIAMIFQEPMTSLNPMITVGKQITEAIQTHREISRADAVGVAVNLLDRVGIRDSKAVFSALPHELSGGMRQRVMIAMAISCRPRVLVADEPTTALDVSIQAQILDLIRELQREEGLAVLFITHDFGVVAEMADRVAVMYAGQIVEESDVFTLFRQPKHPYTRALMESMPSLTGPRDELTVIEGSVPTPSDMPSGCRFARRCPQVQSVCHERPAPMVHVEGSEVRCWLAVDAEERA